jgi:hypothetical protein
MAAACLGMLTAQAQIQIGLDQLAPKAKETVDIKLDGAMLQLASKFLSAGKSDDDKFAKLINGLKAIAVKRFEFAQEGQYRPEDLDAVRAQLQAPGWAKIIGNRSGRETSEIYLKSDTGHITGLAILAAEPKELTVVDIEGAVDLNDLGDLAGRFGIPGNILPNANQKDSKDKGKDKTKGNQ